MKLHDLRPAAGSRQERTRVGRGISAGKGKTAGRGTKGQKSRAGSGLPAWHEGGQTPIHIRVPKLRGFKRRFRVEYEIVNVGRITEYADDGRFADAEEAGRTASTAGGRKASDAPLTVNAEILRQAGLIGTVRRPVKVLGNGEVTRKLFVVADAVTRSAREKIEAAGGTVQLLELPPQPGTQNQEKQAQRRIERAAEKSRAAEAKKQRSGGGTSAQPDKRESASASRGPNATEAEPSAESAAPADDGGATPTVAADESADAET